jgi:DNA-binding LytR/AlgR family response regulator
MTKINVGDLHEKLAAAGIPVVTVRLTRELKVELELADNATDAQKAEAQTIVDGYDQAAVDAAKVQPVTLDDINNAKSVADLKAIVARMHATKG